MNEWMKPNAVIDRWGMNELKNKNKSALILQINDDLNTNFY